MADGPVNPLLRLIRRLAAERAGRDASDGELLGRFVADRDEAAFETLVRRHGRLVRGVCRRFLPDPNDADDAFQATFLVLVHKAGAVRRRDSVAGWLYGVAVRVARKARARNVRRRGREGPLGDLPAPEAARTDDAGELRAVLDEEIDRLPECYRLPVVLCYLEGKTYAETARLLGWAEGTVSGRLARARERLAKRLTRRGLALSAPALVATLAQSSPAAVPPLLVQSTVNTAAAFAAGSALTAGAAVPAVLAKGVLNAMLLTKLKVGTAVVLGALAVSGAGVQGYRMTLGVSGEAPAAQGGGDRAVAAEPAAAPPRGVTKATLAQKKATYQAAKVEYEARDKEFKSGRGTLDIFLESARVLLQAELDLNQGDKAAQRAAHDAHVSRTFEAFEIARKRYEAGRMPIQEFAQIRRHYELARAGKAAAALPIEERLQLLLKERQEAAREEQDARFKEFVAGRGTLEFVLESTKRLLTASLELAKKPAEQVAAYEAYLKVMKEAEGVNQARFDAGRIAIELLALSRYSRLEAEIWLERAKAGQEPSKIKR